MIATASGQRIETATILGADEVIDTETSDFTTIEPVDLVFDTGGGDRLSRSVTVVESGGQLVSVAEEPPLDLCAEHGVEGVFFIVEPNLDQLAELARLTDRGQLVAGGQDLSARRGKRGVPAKSRSPRAGQGGARCRGRPLSCLC